MKNLIFLGQLIRDVMTLALSFVLARSIFSGLLKLVETRYTLMQMPVMELVVVLIITQIILEWSNSQSSLKN